MGVTSQFDDEAVLAFPFALEQVWAVVSDLERIGEWSPECKGIDWVAPATGADLGAQFVGHNRMGPMSWRTTCTIVAWEPFRGLAYDARHVSGAVTRWSFDLEPDAKGTVVTQRFATMGSPRMIMLADRLAGRPARLRGGMVRTLEAMRDSLG